MSSKTIIRNSFPLITLNKQGLFEHSQTSLVYYTTSLIIRMLQF